MKLSIGMVAVMLLIVGCNKSDFEFENKYDESYKTWQNFKESVDNSYTYKTTGISWVGLTWETTIIVSNGVVTCREFKCVCSEGFDGEIPEEDLAWTEIDGDVGSKKNTSASDAITLDEVYEKAKNDWLQERKNSETFFEMKNNGIISLCGYKEKDCVDDCFRGITIVSVEALK